MLSKQSVENETTLWKAFCRFDLDGDGRITTADLEIFTEKEGAEGDLDEAAFATALANLMNDRNSSDLTSISLKEFKAIMRKEEAPVPPQEEAPVPPQEEAPVPPQEETP